LHLDLHTTISPVIFCHRGLRRESDYGGLARCPRKFSAGAGKIRTRFLIDVGDVYQGTDVSLRNKAVMIDLFNHLRYDA